MYVMVKRRKRNSIPNCWSLAHHRVISQKPIAEIFLDAINLASHDQSNEVKRPLNLQLKSQSIVTTMSSSLTRIAPSVARGTAARFSLAAASAQSSSQSSAATAIASSSIRTSPSSSVRAFSNTAKPSKAADTGASTSSGGDQPIPGHNMGPILFGVAVASFGIVGASVTDWKLTHDKSNPEGGLKRSATEYFDLERKNTEPTK